MNNKPIVYFASKYKGSIYFYRSISKLRRFSDLPAKMTYIFQLRHLFCIYSMKMYLKGKICTEMYF